MAAIANIMFALFTHACLRTLSYNTIGMLAVWLMASVLMADLKAFRLQHFITGVLLACAVLCCPYMILAYVLYMIACLWKRQKKETFGIEALGWVTAGSGFIALIFIVFVLSRTSLTTVLESIGYILADPAHKQKGIMAFMEPVLWFVNWFKLYFLAFLAGGVIAVFSRKYRSSAVGIDRFAQLYNDREKGLGFVYKRLDARYDLCVLHESVKQSGNLCHV